eukprot:scaffold666_cov272-Chaetoceros_neogracile.AAC.14
MSEREGGGDANNVEYDVYSNLFGSRKKEGRAKEKKVTGGTTEQQATPVISRRQPNKKVKTTTGLIPHSLSFTLIT